MLHTAIELLPKQEAFVLSGYREVLYSGAYGAAKTVALCTKAAYRAQVPGAIELLCRYRLTDLEATTLRTLLAGTSTTPPILPEGSYRHWKKDRRIEIFGGGEIHYQAVDKLSKLGSREFSGVGFDEATDNADEQLWDTLIGRIRHKIDGLPLQIYAACNPGPPTHFLAKRFGIASGETARPGTHLITTTSFDNPHLPAEYVENLKNYTGMMYLRYVLGKWVAADGLVYGCWDRSKHIVEVRGRRDWKRAWIGIDDGYAAAFAALLAFEDTSGRVFLVAERYGPGMTERMRLGAVRELVQIANAFDVPIAKIVCDSAAADFIGAMRADGMEVTLANKAIEDGIAATRAMIEADRLFFDSRMVKTIGEIEGYGYDPKTGKVVKKNDHACDALRYMVMGMEGVGHVSVFPREAMREPIQLPERSCDIVLAAPRGMELDVALASGKREAVSMVPKMPGPVTIYQEPQRRARYAIGVSAGEGKVRTFAVVAEVEHRRVVAEMSIPSADAVRAVVGLALWYKPESVCVLAHTPAGLYMAGQLIGYELPVSGGREGWKPSDRELNDAILDLRVAWEGRHFEDPGQRARAEALAYRWTATRAEHVQVSEMPELRATWADRVLARVALLRILNQMAPTDLELAVDPFSGEVAHKEVGDYYRALMGG